MSFTKVTRQIGVGLHALETIGKIAKGFAPDSYQGKADQAVSILATIAGIYDAAVGGIERGSDIGDIEQEIAKLANLNDENWRAFQEALDARRKDEQK